MSKPKRISELMDQHDGMRELLPHRPGRQIEATMTTDPAHRCWRLLADYRAGQPVDVIAAGLGITIEEAKAEIMLALRSSRR